MNTTLIFRKIKFSENWPSQPLILITSIKWKWRKGNVSLVTPDRVLEQKKNYVMSNYFYPCLYTVLCNCDPAVGVKYSLAGIVTTNYLFN